MKFEDVKKLAVIGAGLMGSQIAQILSQVGAYEVHMVDINDELVAKGLSNIEERLDRFFVSKGKMTDDEKDAILSRIQVYTDIDEGVRQADFIIEAIAENLSLKKEIFKAFDQLAPRTSILASNTSYQNISELAFVTKAPENVLGMHFFNPVPRMKLVEVVRGARTSVEVLELACELAKRLGKEPVICRDTSYGFLANRAYSAMMDETVQMVWERVAPPAEIDKALKLGYNLPMGPLELMDFTGSWSIRVASEQDKMRELGPERGRLHPLIRMMYRSGYNSVYKFWEEIMSKW
ncbi:MAG: 3-hydroxyacyl-CoA dehydrogenase family protein [Thermodesulfobacteriota bacterium]